MSVLGAAGEGEKWLKKPSRFDYSTGLDITLANMKLYGDLSSGANKNCLP